MSTANVAVNDIPYECRYAYPLRHRKKDGPHSTPKYGLLFAASAGCLPCVRYWVEQENISVDSASDNHATWDVRSYAAEGKPGAGKYEVLQYLDAVSAHEGLEDTFRHT